MEDKEPLTTKEHKPKTVFCLDFESTNSEFILKACRLCPFPSLRERLLTSQWKHHRRFQCPGLGPVLQVTGGRVLRPRLLTPLMTLSPVGPAPCHTPGILSNRPKPIYLSPGEQF